MVLGATQSSSSWVGLIGSRFITDRGGARTYTLPARTAHVNNTTRTAVAQRPSAVAQADRAVERRGVEEEGHARALARSRLTEFRAAQVWPAVSRCCRGDACAEIARAGAAQRK